MSSINLPDLPTLSVVMVVRNAAKTIARALDSLAMQHYPKLELIVWDGQSTDGTLDILKRYESLITILKSEPDKNSPDGCNKAVQLATGDYVGFLYGDDEYEPGTLWAVANAIVAEPMSDVVSFGMLYRKIDKHGNARVTGYYADAAQLALTLDKVLSDLPTFVLSRFYKRGLFGPLNIERHHANDRELMAELALKSLHNTIIPKALYGFTMHDEGISSNPAHYSAIVEEHMAIAKSLLARPELTEAQRDIIRHWQQRQLVFGCVKTLCRGQFKAAQAFVEQGMELGAGQFVWLGITLPLVKLVKRVGLLISGGIDRG